LGPEHAQLSNSALEDLIADLIAPWYFSFFVSWQGVDSIRTTYDEVRESPRDVVARICERARIKADGATIERAIAAARAKARRFNKGVSGRGESISPNARERIASFARHFPDVDFGPIGIPRAATPIPRQA
jgi:hypothetical protein